MYTRSLITCSWLIAQLLSVRIHRRASRRLRVPPQNVTDESGYTSAQIFESIGMVANWMNGPFYPITDKEIEIARRLHEDKDYHKDEQEHDLDLRYNENWQLVGSHQGVIGSSTKVVFHLITPYGRLELESKSSDECEARVYQRTQGDWFSVEVYPKYWVPRKTEDISYWVEDKHGILDITWNGDGDADLTVKEVKIDSRFSGRASAEQLISEIGIGDRLTAVSTKKRINPSRLMPCLPDISIPLVEVEDRSVDKMKRRIRETKGARKMLEFVKGGKARLPMRWSSHSQEIKKSLQEAFDMPSCCSSFQIQIPKDSSQEFMNDAQASLQDADAPRKIKLGGNDICTMEGNFSWSGLVVLNIIEEVREGIVPAGDATIAFQGLLEKNDVVVDVGKVPDNIKNNMLAKKRVGARRS